MFICEEKDNLKIQKEVNPDLTMPPHREGIYLMADAAYDVYRQQTLLLLKIGYSTDLAKRRADYSRNNRTAFLIDYCDYAPINYICGGFKEMERDFHDKWIKNGYQQIDGSEWFVVTKEEFNYWFTKGLRLPKLPEDWIDLPNQYIRGQIVQKDECIVTDSKTKREFIMKRVDAEKLLN